jgi:hypothetical protein
MAKLPITKIVIRITDPAMVTDTWGLFDHIILAMEKMERDQTGDKNPIVDALGRKRFRVEVTKALRDGQPPMDVFNRWVTVLVPQFVPIGSTQSSMSQEELLARVAGMETDAVEQARVAAVAEAKRARNAANLVTARAAKKRSPWRKKGAVAKGPTKEEKVKKALEGLEE